MANAGVASFEVWSGSSGNIGGGSVSALTAAAVATEQLGAVLEALTATGTVVLTSANGVAALEFFTASGETALNAVGLTGTASFEKWVAEGRTPGAGAAVFEALSATGLVRGANIGAAAFEALIVNSLAGAPAFEPLVAQGLARSGVAATYFTGVMNSRSRGVTEYNNFPFNSYARIGSRWYAAGPGGLYVLGEDDDDGTPITWVIKTGQMDDGDIELKRLPEVLLGLRSNGKVRVRVWPDDNVSHEYILPAVLTSTIHQHRVKSGKGMRGRWYAVELRDYNGTDIELDSMQVNMIKTTRRLG